MPKLILDRILIIRLSIYAAALALLVYSIFPCIGLTFDSELYMQAAEDLLHKGFYQPGFMAKPPLYPLILFLLGNKLWAVALLNVLCWLISAILIEWLLAQLSWQSATERVFQSLCIAFSTGMFLVHNFVWTEPIFGVLAFYFLISLEKEQSGRLLLLSVTGLMMVALRHMGILFVAGGMVTLIHSKKFSKQDFTWVATSLGFFAGWQLFVYLTRGDFGRLDHFASLDLMDNYRQIGKSLMHWFLPIEIPFLHFLFPFMIAGLMVWFFFTQSSLGLKALAATTLIHLAVIVSKGEFIYDDVERYLFFLSPVLLPIIYKTVPRGRNSRIAVTAIVLAVLCWTIVRTVKNSLFWHDAFCS